MLTIPLTNFLLTVTPRPTWLGFCFEESLYENENFSHPSHNVNFKEAKKWNILFYLQVESRYGIFPNWPKIPGPENRELREFTIFLIFLFSQSTGLVTSASSRHMEPMSNSNGISLDELAGRGNFIPRPQADVKMRWYDLFSKK